VSSTMKGGQQDGGYGQVRGNSTGGGGSIKPRKGELGDGAATHRWEGSGNDYLGRGKRRRIKMAAGMQAGDGKSLNSRQGGCWENVKNWEVVKGNEKEVK